MPSPRSTDRLLSLAPALAVAILTGCGSSGPSDLPGGPDAGEVDSSPDAGSKPPPRACAPRAIRTPAPPPADAACNEHGWCWEDPIPFGDALHALWVAGKDEVWAASTGGNVLRWNGTRWSVENTGTREDLAGIHGSSSADVWVTGRNQALIRFDGNAWSGATIPWGSGRGGLYVAPGDGWLSEAVGEFSRMYRRGASGWSLMNNPAGWRFSWLYGLSANEVYAIEGNSGMARWSGTGWSRLPGFLPSPSSLGGDYAGLWVASDASTAWAVAETGVVGRWNGSDWWDEVTMPRKIALSGVWGSGPADVWMAGAGGALFHWNGAGVVEASSGLTGDLLAIGGSAADDVWAVGEGGAIARLSGGGWTPITRRLRDRTYWNALVVGAQDDAWLFGSEGDVPRAMRWDGQSWTPTAPPSDGQVIGFAACADDVWVLGPSGYQHWDGERWTIHPVDFLAGSLAMHGTGPGDIWSVGGAGILNHYDGERWSYQGYLSYALHDVFGLAPDLYYAVGYTGVVARYDGASWKSVTPKLTESTLRGVWASGPNDVWAVGEEGTILHFDGTSWTVDTTSAAGVGLEDVWGTGPTDVWAAGWGGGALFHFDGQNWSQKSAGTGATLTTVSGSGSALWLFGGDLDGQKLLRRAP